MICLGHWLCLARVFLAGFGHVICLGMLYFLVHVKQAQSVVCNLWIVSGSRDRLACVVSRLCLCIICVYEVSFSLLIIVLNVLIFCTIIYIAGWGFGECMLSVGFRLLL